jgi:hypothetical protein
MTKITWRGAEGYEEGETPPRSCTWAGITFPVGVAVEVDDPTMIDKAKGNRFFKVAEDEPKVYGPPPVPAYIPAQWREPDTEADPADVSFYDDPPPSSDFADVLPDLPLKRKRGRPPKVREAGDVDQ